tara:strand:+ start:120 stop:629 length:510 start_codon:yes stop_codon:yes gene_type:complete
MAWYDSIVDWGAEAIGYVDEDFIDITGDVYEGLSAGDQFIDDASDAYGFIKQGAKAYGMLSGTIGADGKRKTGPQQVFKQSKMAQSRSYKGMGFGRTSPQFNVSQGSTMAVGANNPNVQTALTNLLNSSYNSQMNNVVSQFAINPNLGQGRKTSTGSTTLARKAKTRTA